MYSPYLQVELNSLCTIQLRPELLESNSARKVTQFLNLVVSILFDVDKNHDELQGLQLKVGQICHFGLFGLAYLSLSTSIGVCETV
jgi:hypothetical protein